jgi:hypothetical protein
MIAFCSFAKAPDNCTAHRIFDRDSQLTAVYGEKGKYSKTVWILDNGFSAEMDKSPR